MSSDNDIFMAGLPIELIRQAYASAPGRELESGKLANVESSAALVANAFGFFLDRHGELPRLPHGSDWGWPAANVGLEKIVRFPWSGGRHPCLDVLVTTSTHVIGIESKRYEPFRTKTDEPLSEAYWRDKWGIEMSGYMRIRDQLRDQVDLFARLDAAQLVKHAFGLRSHVHRANGDGHGKRPILYYLYAEPQKWSNERAIDAAVHYQHRADIKRFADIVAKDEVVFRTCSYRDLLTSWSASPSARIRAHADALSLRFLV